MMEQLQPLRAMSPAAHNGETVERVLPWPQGTVAADRPSLAVLMTSFNRRESTLACLRALYEQQCTHPVQMEVFLVDDLSRDGTAAAVQATFPEVHVSRGTGDLFWNRGMRVAFAQALDAGFDFYLWLNDDTLLLPGALESLLHTSHELAAEGITAIVTGSTCDPAGRRSYGGIDLKGRWIRSLQPAGPLPDRPLACGTMNGNCTLIPAAIAGVLGNLDRVFHHSFGDMDYGFRARKAGFAVYVAPGFLGTCTDNSRKGTWRDASASFRARWRHLTSAKGSPFREWFVYCRRHLGPLWPLYAVSPYVKTLLGGLLPR